MHDDAYIGGWYMHDDLGWKNQTTRYILPHHWLYEWFSQFHSCGTYSVLSPSPSIVTCVDVLANHILDYIAMPEHTPGPNISVIFISQDNTTACVVTWFTLDCICYIWFSVSQLFWFSCQWSASRKTPMMKPIVSQGDYLAETKLMNVLHILFVLLSVCSLPLNGAKWHVWNNRGLI